MSELKEIGIRWEENGELHFSHVYLKHQVDKVIAEMKKACNSKDDWCLHTLKENRHHKYKRCLAMAAVCFEKSYSTTLVKYDKESGLLRNFYDWWGKRWLELAEKFKPNSTAQ